MYYRINIQYCNTVNFALKLRPIKQVSGTKFIHSCFYCWGTFVVIVHVITENIRLRLGKRFLGENIHFSISSYSVSATLKAHNDTLFEANSSFENGRNLM